MISEYFWLKSINKKNKKENNNVTNILIMKRSNNYLQLNKLNLDSLINSYNLYLYMIRHFLPDKLNKMLEEYFLNIFCEAIVILSTPSKYSMRFSDLFKNFTSFTFAMVQKNSKFCRSQLLYISTFGKQMD